MTPTTFPVALHLRGRACLVVGGGDDAEQRAGRLRSAGAVVRQVAAPDFAEAMLDDVWLAVQTERDSALAARIARACEARRVFFCATDDPAQSSYSHMAIARAGSVKIAVSTDGRAPALARRLREELQRLLDRAALAAFAARLAKLRDETPSGERARVLGAAVAGLRLTGELELPELGGEDEPG